MSFSNHALLEVQGGVSHYNDDQLLTLMKASAHAAGATIVGENMHAFGEGCGFTGILMLAESHISVHTWPEDNYAAFDIFMCGSADIAAAVEVIRSAVPDGIVDVNIIPRGVRRESAASLQSV